MYRTRLLTGLSRRFGTSYAEEVGCGAVGAAKVQGRLSTYSPEHRSRSRRAYNFSSETTVMKPSKQSASLCHLGPALTKRFRSKEFGNRPYEPALCDRRIRTYTLLSEGCFCEDPMRTISGQGRNPLPNDLKGRQLEAAIAMAYRAMILARPKSHCRA